MGNWLNRKCLTNTSGSGYDGKKERGEQTLHNQVGGDSLIGLETTKESMGFLFSINGVSGGISGTSFLLLFPRGKTHTLSH